MAESPDTPGAALQAPPAVLLVEDNPADVRMIREALEVSRIAHRLYVVEDGELALDFVNRRGGFANSPRPDLVLMDLKIPKLHGHDVIERLRAESGNARLPIVVLTGSRLEKDFERSM